MKMKNQFLLLFLCLISIPLHCSENKTSELKLFKTSENKLKLLIEAMNKYYDETEDIHNLIEDLKKEDTNLKKFILLEDAYGYSATTKLIALYIAYIAKKPYFLFNRAGNPGYYMKCEEFLKSKSKKNPVIIVENLIDCKEGISPQDDPFYYVQKFAENHLVVGISHCLTTLHSKIKSLLCNPVLINKHIHSLIVPLKAKVYDYVTTAEVCTRLFGNTEKASKVRDLLYHLSNPQQGLNLLTCVHNWCREREIDGLLGEDKGITTESDAFVIAMWELFLTEKLSIDTAQNIFKLVPTHSDILNKKESHVIKYHELQKAIKCFKDNYKKLGLKI